MVEGGRFYSRHVSGKYGCDIVPTEYSVKKSCLGKKGEET